LHLEATRAIMIELGYDLSPEDYIECFLLERNGSWHLLNIDGNEVERLRQLRNIHYSELLGKDVRIYDGIVKIFQA